MSKTIFNKRVLITGVCGTVGREVLNQVLKEKPAQVIGLDNNETELFFLSDVYRQDSRIDFFFADVRDLDSLSQRMKGIQIVLHTAAMKHVIVSEKSPRDTIRTNILGVQNIIDAALLNDVQKVVFTSSDKAVNPTNIMGTSKLMGERLMTAASAVIQPNGPIFTSIRFGNVMGSRGSVIPLFKKQIAHGGPVTVTDPRMTRFIMSIKQAVRLVIDAAGLAKGGEVFVTKMPVIRIEDLARVMIRELAAKQGGSAENIRIEVIGVKPGEKMYEELINEEEVRRTIELERYYVITPAFKAANSDVKYDYPHTLSGKIHKTYNSAHEQPMSQTHLAEFLKQCNVIC